MAEQHAFDLDRGDVLAAADDDVLDPIADLDVPVGVHDRSVAGVEVAAAQRSGARVGVVVVALHHDVAAHDDLADGRAVVRDLAVGVVDDQQLAGRDELYALARLDHGAVGGRQRGVLGALLAHRDERRGLGEAVDVGDYPAELLLDPIDRRRCRRRAGGEHAHAGRRTLADVIGGVGDADQHGGRGAQHRDALARQLGEDPRRLDAAQTDVGAAGGGDRPHEGPAVGVEHRQRPQVALDHGGHRHVEQRADDVEVRVAVRDHHALGACRGAAGIVDGEQVALADLGALEPAADRGDQLLVCEPALARPLERDEVHDARDLVADPVDHLEIVGVRAHHAAAAVRDDVCEVLGGEPVVDRHQHRAELRYGVERLELRVGVGRDVRDAIALLDAELLGHRRRPAIAAVAELLVGQPQVAVDQRFVVGIEAPRPAHEVEGGEWSLHRPAKHRTATVGVTRVSAPDGRATRPSRPGCGPRAWRGRGRGRRARASRPSRRRRATRPRPCSR